MTKEEIEQRLQVISGEIFFAKCLWENTTDEREHYRLQERIHRLLEEKRQLQETRQ